MSYNLRYEAFEIVNERFTIVVNLLRYEAFEVANERFTTIVTQLLRCLLRCTHEQMLHIRIFKKRLLMQGILQHLHLIYDCLRRAVAKQQPAANHASCYR